MSILAIDAGTTGVTAVVVSPDGTIVAKGNEEFRQHFPQPGWVEHAHADSCSDRTTSSTFWSLQDRSGATRIS